MSFTKRTEPTTLKPATFEYPKFKWGCALRLHKPAEGNERICRTCMDEMKAVSDQLFNMEVEKMMLQANPMYLFPKCDHVALSGLSAGMVTKFCGKPECAPKIVQATPEITYEEFRDQEAKRRGPDHGRAQGHKRAVPAHVREARPVPSHRP